MSSTSIASVTSFSQLTSIAPLSVEDVASTFVIHLLRKGYTVEQIASVGNIVTMSAAALKSYEKVEQPADETGVNPQNHEAMQDAILSRRRPKPSS